MIVVLNRKLHSGANFIFTGNYLIDTDKLNSVRVHGLGTRFFMPMTMFETEYF